MQLAKVYLSRITEMITCSAHLSHLKRAFNQQKQSFKKNLKTMLGIIYLKENSITNGIGVIPNPCLSCNIYPWIFQNIIAHLQPLTEKDPTLKKVFLEKYQNTILVFKQPFSLAELTFITKHSAIQNTLNGSGVCLSMKWKLPTSLK